MDFKTQHICHYYQRNVVLMGWQKTGLNNNLRGWSFKAMG